MGLFSYDIKSMDDLYLHQLQDIYYAEQRILTALPQMIEQAGAGDLRQSFQSHLAETRTQVDRLERVFQMMGKSPQGSSCPAIDGIIKEANDLASEIEDQSVLDAALAASAQAVEHYEITRYGTLIAWSRELGRTDLAALLSETLEEEKAADQKLTMIAEQRLNRAA